MLVHPARSLHPPISLFTSNTPAIHIKPFRLQNWVSLVFQPPSLVFLFRSSGSRRSPRERSTAQTRARCEVLLARQRRRVDRALLRLANGDKNYSWVAFFPFFSSLHPLLPLHHLLLTPLPNRPTAEPAHSPRKSRFKAVPGIDLTANLQRRFACGRALIRPAFLFRPLSFRRSRPLPPCVLPVLLSLNAHQTVADNVSELQRQEIQIGY